MKKPLEMVAVSEELESSKTIIKEFVDSQKGLYKIVNMGRSPNDKCKLSFDIASNFSKMVKDIHVVPSCKVYKVI